VSLEAARLSATPARPRAGKPFVLTLAVRRSDTGKGVTSGTVSCRVLLNEKKVPAKGSVVRGSGRCAFVVPASAKGKLLRGTITVRSSGKSVAADFSYLVL
jgi:hypothetical protein